MGSFGHFRGWPEKFQENVRSKYTQMFAFVSTAPPEDFRKCAGAQCSSGSSIMELEDSPQRCSTESWVIKPLFTSSHLCVAH